METVPVFRYVPKSTSHLKFIATGCATLYAILDWTVFSWPELKGDEKKSFERYALVSQILAVIGAVLAFLPIFCRPKGKSELCPLDSFSGFLAGGSLIVCAVLQFMMAQLVAFSVKQNPADVKFMDWLTALDRLVGLVLLSVGAVYCFIFAFQTCEENRNMTPPKKKKKSDVVNETDGVVGIRYALTQGEFVEVVAAAVKVDRQLQNATSVVHVDVSEAVEEACASLPPCIQTATVVCDNDENHFMGPKELPPSYNNMIEPC